MTDDSLWLRFEDHHERFMNLMKARDFIEAAHVMERAAAEFESVAPADMSAHAMDMAGSAYSCAGMDQEALDAMVRAADLSPEDPLHQLTVGRFLLDALDDPNSALPRIERAVALAANDPNSLYCLPDALGLQGAAWLRLGRTEEAAQRFEKICGSASSGPIKPLVDLRLASEFVKRGERLEECAQLAEHVLEWARVTKNDDLQTRATHLKKSIKERPGSSLKRDA